MEAHDSPLRGLALTADGSKLATASIKGTVLRVWDVATSTCLQEFRRGVERATITCLCWSWDYAWLSCTSDKGTAHVFYVGGDHGEGASSHPSSPSPKSSSLTSRFFRSVKKSLLEGEAKKSVCQIRGVPHPLACTFVADAPNSLAVAGWDADGNGVLLISEFVANQEPRRIAYHVLVRSSSQHTLSDETEEERRRRRLRGWTPTIPATTSLPPNGCGGQVVVGERYDQDVVFGMEQIQFDDKGDFVQISTGGGDSSSNKVKSPRIDTKALEKANHNQDQMDGSDAIEDDDKGDSTTMQDSVRTEPLDDPDTIPDDEDEDPGPSTKPTATPTSRSTTQATQ